MENNRKQETLKMIFIVLFFGALWGIVEATLGTLLHLSFFKGLGIYAKSSTVLLPIALVLMANCYKKSNALYSVFLMGIVAGLIKLTTGFALGFINIVWQPAIYIVLESLAMGAALAIFRPTNVVSLRTLASVIFASTVYQFSYLAISSLITPTNAFASFEVWQKVGEKYLFLYNGVAILYMFIGGAISYGVVKLLAKLNVNTKFDINKIIYSPITASLSMIVAIGVTIGLASL